MIESEKFNKKHSDIISGRGLCISFPSIRRLLDQELKTNRRNFGMNLKNIFKNLDIKIVEITFNYGHTEIIVDKKVPNIIGQYLNRIENNITEELNYLTKY